MGYLVGEGMAPHSGATTQPHLEWGGRCGVGQGCVLYSGVDGGGVTGAVSHKGATPSEQRIYLFLAPSCPLSLP